MGTNYYVTTAAPCPTCGHEQTEDTLHLGKFSGGWRFNLHVYPNHWVSTYQLILFLLEHDGDPDYFIHNDNNGDNDVRKLISRIIMCMGKKADTQYRVGYDDLSDYFENDFS